MTTVIMIKGGERGLMKSPGKVSIPSVSSETNRKAPWRRITPERNLVAWQEETPGKMKEKCDGSHWTLQAHRLNCVAAISL